MLKTFLTLGFWVTAGLIHAQKTPRKVRAFFRSELTFATDNDAFLLQKHDAFYSNGFFLKLAKAGEKKGNKHIRSFELGQMIYTPLSRKTESIADIDRPYCGYLFLKYNQAQFLPKKSILQYSAALGVVGPASAGEGMQNSYHKLLRYARFTGWEYQVRNALGIDLGITYARTIWEDSSWIKLVPVGQLNLGTTFTNARLGMYTSLGIFEKNSSSALWNARIQTQSVETRKKYELFMYWYPQIIFQGYNATVEGGLFNKGPDAILGQTEPWMLQQNLGLCYAEGRWTTRLELVYQTKEARTQKGPHRYGSIQLSYRMR